MLKNPEVIPDVVGHQAERPSATGAETPQDRHDREVRESRREERRLLLWEVVCLVLVGLFVVVRQLWLV